MNNKSASSTKNQFCFALLISFFFTLNLQAQEKLSANIGLGLGVPFTDLTENNYQGNRANLAVTAGLGYQLGNYFRLRGDALAGQLNGNNDVLYYQATIYEGSLALEFNIMRMFSKETNFKLNIVGGMGYGFLSSSSYDIETRERVIEIPIRGAADYSYQAFFLGGMNVGIPFTPNFDLNLGYGHRQVLAQPWIDATQSGTETDVYGMITMGFTFKLGKPKEEGKIEVDERRFANLRMRVDSLERTAAESSDATEQIATLEKSNQEKEMEIEILKIEIDSLKVARASEKIAQKGEKADITLRAVDTKKGSNKSAQKATDVTEVNSDLLGKVMYRVIVGSLPSRSLAQKFIESSNLDDSEMIIAYMENIDRFRVIYKSAESKAEARKYLLEARRKYKDAWITQF